MQMEKLIKRSYILEGKEYLDGVTAITVTLNNEHDIEGMLQSLVKNKPSQIIIVDGGSTDRTVEIAKKYTNDVFVTEKGIGKQFLYGANKVKYKYFFSIECDHIYPDNFLENFIKEYKDSGLFGIQATLKCINQDTFFEKGISLFYDIHQLKKGKRDMIAAPNIYPSKEYIEILDVQDFNGYSIDAKIGISLEENNYAVGLGKTIAYQYEIMDFNIFCKKYFNYGKGDYDFYEAYKSQWTTKRKLKSIFHVFNRYIVDYPIKSFKIGKPYIAIPYLWASAVVRYSGWAYSFLRSFGR
jgi:glycosyltransferase involved in cell wall biosynthesis